MAVDRPLIVYPKALPYRLPLGRPWRTSGEVIKERCGLLVLLQTEDGVCGYGDCAPLPSIGSESLPQAQARLRELFFSLLRLTPQEALAQLPPEPEFPAARCGIESALLDLISRLEGKPLHRWLNPESSPEVRVNAALGGLETETVTRARTALAEGFRVLKIKIGRTGVATALRLLERLSAELPGGAQLRLDANRAWDFQEARGFLRGIEGLPIESLEEPLKRFQLEQLAELQSESPCALALDESLLEMDIDRLLQQRPVRRLILKPMAHGGLLPVLELARQAEAADIESVVTTALDSAAGVWATAHLAAALNNPLAHGLATAEWLVRDVGMPPLISNGVIQLTAAPGFGFSPDNDLLAREPQIS